MYVAIIGDLVRSRQIRDRNAVQCQLQAALDAGYVDAKTDVHTACMDICTIIKGCVFEWCLVNGDMDIRKSVYRIIGNYLNPFLR